MKKIFFFLRVFQFVCISFQLCQKEEHYFKIIDKWWKVYGVADEEFYHPVFICSNMLSVDVRDDYEDYVDYISDESNYAVIISDSRIATLSNNAYWGTYTEYLKGIKLSNNSIEMIEEGAFRSCTNLKEVNLKDNKITSLPNGLFSDNNNLEIIDLSCNTISSIGNSTFPHNIKYLNLNRNHLHKIDVIWPESLVNLELGFNAILFITNASFSELTHLEILKLNNNGLKTIPIGLFNPNSDLEEIDLPHNNIYTVGKVALSLHKIKHLNLEHNRLGTLDFMLPPSLESLDLSFNLISSIDHNSFSAMKNPVVLFLNNNSLENLPLGVLNELESLKTAFIQHNHITSLRGDLFAPHKNLIEVDLSYNNISTIEETVFTSSSIKFLNLTKNKIKYFNFSLPESVTNLDISFNSVVEVAENCFLKTTNLTTLKINNNFLKNIPLGLFNAFNRETVPYNGMKNLYLQNNKLENLSFELPRTLINLDLSHNSISVLKQGIFDGLSSLTNLQLDNNLLHTLPMGCFLSLKSLKQLYLSNNTISVTYGTFSGLKALERLKISNNSITELSFLNGLNNLFDLDISNNLLTNLEVRDITKQLKGLRYLYLQNNKFQCDHLLEVITQLKANNIVTKGEDNVFESNIRGIHCIHGKSTQKPVKKENIFNNTNEDVKLLKKMINLISNSVKQQQVNKNYSTHLNFFKSMANATERLQETLEELNNNIISGNISKQRLQHTLEIINSNLISEETISNNSKKTFRHILEKMSSNLNIQRKMFNYSYAANQLEILKELLKELKEKNEHVPFVKQPYVAEHKNALKMSLLNNISHMLSTYTNVEKTSLKYIFVNIILYGIFVISCCLLYIRYMKMKAKKATNVTGSTEI